MHHKWLSQPHSCQIRPRRVYILDPVNGDQSGSDYFFRFVLQLKGPFTILEIAVFHLITALWRFLRKSYSSFSSSFNFQLPQLYKQSPHCQGHVNHRSPKNGSHGRFPRLTFLSATGCYLPPSSGIKNREIVLFQAAAPTLEVDK